jgi:hypothetical protein
MRAYYIKYYKILSRVIKEAKRQRYGRLTAKLDNQIKTTWNIIKHETGKLCLTEQIPSLLIKNEKVKDPEVNADAFNIFFLTITENPDLHQEVRSNAISFSKDTFPRKFPGLQTILITETEIKSIIHSLKPKKKLFRL